MNHHLKTAHELQDLYTKDSLSPDQMLQSLESAVAATGDKIRAYVDFDPKKAVRKNLPKDARYPLWGVPIALKDNLCVEGWEVTCGSKILKNFYAPYHATVVERLIAAGAIIVGRANMDEFAFGSSCESSCYGPTRNPWDSSRVPGGSSGGSAAAVAGNLAIAALGSDTGGSIRQPASLCGVVGLKPTYGRVSRYGLIAFASSLDQIGPLTKDVRDAALILKVIAGHDAKDSTSADLPVPDYMMSLGKSVKGMKVGIPKEYFIKGLSPEVESAVKAAIQTYERLGAVIQDISLPHTRYAVSVYYVVAPSEASSNLARFDGVRFGYRDKDALSLAAMYAESRGKGFGAEAKRRIVLGTFALSSGYYDAYYLRAMKVRTKIKHDFDEAFKKVDVILTPTAPSTAFKIGEKTQNPLEMYLSDIFTISANLAGIPGMSIPCGFSKDNLPIGLQLLGKPFDEGTLFQLGHAFEQNTEFHLKRPC